MTAMEKCLAMNREIYDAVKRSIRPGITEEEIKEIFLNAAFHGSYEITDYEYNLMVGPCTAQIGLKEAGAILKPGDPVLFDLLVKVDGYWSDTTRVFFCGQPRRELKKMYGAVERVLQKVSQYVQAGMRCGEVWKYTCDCVAAEGYEGCFPHHAGHVIGKEVVVSDFVEGNDERIPLGSFIALEPGIYMDGVGGVRLENNYVVSGTGVVDILGYPSAFEDAVVF